jgi:DNA-binding NarL/FixJ family response regulator
MDIRMPDGSGIDACRAITEDPGEIPVIMLTSHADSDALFDAIDAGASGYVLKQVGSRELIEAVRTVAGGGSLLDPAVTRRVLDRLRNATRLEEAGAFSELTEQERRVLAHIADGASNREIGQRMGLAEKTVRNYVSSILAKLALESRAQAAAYAIRNRLPELEEAGA